MDADKRRIDGVPLATPVESLATLKTPAEAGTLNAVFEVRYRIAISSG